MRVKEESEKAGLKLNIQKRKVMASGPITSWQIERGKLEAVTDFIFLGSYITVDSDCSCEIKRCLLLGRTAMTNLGRVLKNRDITLPTKVHVVKVMVFPVVMYKCKKACMLTCFSHVRLFLTLWTVAHQDPPFFPISQNFFKFMSIESVRLSNHLTLCHPLLPLPSIFPSIKVFSTSIPK